MVKERKAIGHKAMLGHPIAQATGIKTWPEDCQTRNTEKILNNGSWKKEISNVPRILTKQQRLKARIYAPNILLTN